MNVLRIPSDRRRFVCEYSSTEKGSRLIVIAGKQTSLLPQGPGPTWLGGLELHRAATVEESDATTLGISPGRSPQALMRRYIN